MRGILCSVIVLYGMLDVFRRKHIIKYIKIYIYIYIKLYQSILKHLIYFNISDKKLKIMQEKEISNIFFIYCLPGIFLGIITINYLASEINFKIIVTSIINRSN